MKRCWLLLSLLLTEFALPADELIPEGYKTIENQTQLVFADDFSKGLGDWRPEGTVELASIQPNAGINGGPGLVCDRCRPDSEPKMTRWFHGTPDRQYTVSVMCRADNVSHTTTQDPDARISIHTFYMDHYDANGKIISGYYTSIKVKNGGGSMDWKKLQADFTYPPNAVKTMIKLGGYTSGSNRDLIGRFSFDDLTIVENGEARPVLYPLLPRQLRLDDTGRLVFRISAPHTNLAKAQFRLYCEGKAYTSPIQNEEAEVILGRLPAGIHQTQAQLLDTEQKLILGSQDYKFIMPNPGSGDFPGRTDVDEHGLLYINGKPFFPMGMSASPTSPEQVEKIRAAGFNCVMPYVSTRLAIGEDRKMPFSIQRTIRALDYLNDHGLKVIYCLKEQIHGGVKEIDGVKGSMNVAAYVVEKLKHHPAILSWYISDENPLNEIDRLKEFRELVSMIDPYHPVSTCTDRPDNQLLFAQTGDIMWPDNYPIHTKASRSMAVIRKHIDASRTRLGYWFTVQAFNWDAIQRGNTQREPTEEEMRSMALLVINNDVRGMDFYSYSTIFSLMEKQRPGSAAAFWPKVAAVGQLLHEMEPFVCSAEKAPAVTVEDKGKNRVEARAYLSNGKLWIAVTADGPGEADAVLRIPGGHSLKPRYGHCTQLSPGVFRFTGTDICSDVLAD